MNKILFLLQLPPPIHGASIVNKSIMDSQAINSIFDAKYVNISPAPNIVDLGKITFGKILNSLRIFIFSINAYLVFKPQLVYITLSPHGAGFYKDGLIAVLLKILGAKLVFHLHGKGINSEVENSSLKKFVYKFVFKGVDVIHLSESLFYDLDSVRDRSRKLFAIPNSVAVPSKSNVKRSSKVITFIYLSNLVRSKGADILIRATLLLPEGLKDKFKVKIVGKSRDAEYLKDIQDLLNKSQHLNIEFLGPKYDEEKYIELQSSDVLVLPTKYKNECFPLSILEAISVGLAVISTAEGAIPDIVKPGVCGELLENCTPEALSQVMVRFIENPEYVKALGTAGKDNYTSNYTVDKFEDKLINALNQSLSN